MIIFAPMPSISETTNCLPPITMQTTKITDAVPVAMPSDVRKDRVLSRVKAPIAPRQISAYSDKNDGIPRLIAFCGFDIRLK
jgi:hypothetical protein